MRYLKLYENFSDKKIVEIVQTIRDILLDLRDDGYNVSISDGSGANFFSDIMDSNFVLNNFAVNRIVSYLENKNIYITISTYDNLVGDDSIRKIKYDEIKGIFNQLISYMESEGYLSSVQCSNIRTSWNKYSDVYPECEYDYFRILFYKK